MAGLYFHIPFCLQKCRYCDFYSVPREAIPFAFVQAIEKEIALRASLLSRESIRTLFFGGGTPSLLPPEWIERICNQVHRYYSLEKELEITLEYNPKTGNAKWMKAYFQLAINRVSLGVQSFCDGSLCVLGRLHTAKEAIKTFHMLRDAGFTNINLDLIFGIPNETVNNFKKTIETALSLSPEHISLYALTLHSDTPLVRKIKEEKWILPEEETVCAMYEWAVSELKDAGYEHYEISNFARPGFRCQHNESYWNGTAYLGFGPSAHSFVGCQRFWNFSNFKKYIEALEKGQLPPGEEECLTPEQQRLEALALGLRKKEGVPLDWIRTKETQLKALLQDGLAIVSGKRLTLTTKGFLLADAVTLVFT